ncbi:hypothetical protein ACFL04_01835 [Patescibacteria group bacterium]
MEEILISINNSLEAISSNLELSRWYNSGWFIGMFGVIAVVIGIVLDRIIQNRMDKKKQMNYKFDMADRSIRLQFSQLLPRLQKLQRKVDTYIAGEAPSFDSETGWSGIKSTLIQNHIDESDSFIKDMEELLNHQRYISPQAAWPNRYSDDIKSLIGKIVGECSAIIKMKPEEVVKRFNL